LQIIAFCLRANSEYKSPGLAVKFLTVLRKVKFLSAHSAGLLDTAIQQAGEADAQVEKDAEDARELRRTIQMAVCMGLDPNLGKNSQVNRLDEELVRIILEYALPPRV
jgi:hypothetical protein